MPIVIVPIGIRAMASALAAAVLVGVTNVSDKDMLQLRNVLAPLLVQFEKLNNSPDFMLPCPHTGEMLEVTFVVACDGAAWCMAAGARGPTCDVGKFPFTTTNSFEILQSEDLHLPTLSDLHEVSATCEEIFEGKTTEQRRSAASDTGGIIGMPLFLIPAIEYRRGALHLLLTPPGYVHTKTCCTLNAHGFLTEGPGHQRRLHALPRRRGARRQAD